VRPYFRSLPAVRKLLLATAALTVLVLTAAVPAGAQVVEVGGNKFGTLAHSESASWEEEGLLEPQAFANTSGNPVVHGSTVIADVWDPAGGRYHADWQQLIDGFLHNMGAGSGSLANEFAVDAQYTDKSNVPAHYIASYHATTADTAPYPAAGCTDPHPLLEGDAVTCLTDKQIRQHLESYVATNNLPKGMGTIYYVLLPPGVTTCTDEGAGATHCSSNVASSSSFCSYHSAITPTNPSTGDGNTILYGVIPWTAGGFGDPKLKASNETISVSCQDGGHDWTHNGAKEKKKTKSAKEKTAFEEMNEEEKHKVERAEEMEGAHQEQPNQAPCPTVFDGGCDTGLADVIINQIASEQQDIVTDPLLNGWQTSIHHWEALDECRNIFAPVISGTVTANENSAAGTLADNSLGEGSYYLNAAFNLAAYKLPSPGAPCLTHVNLLPAFTAPNPVATGELVGFNGMESNISLNVADDFPGGGAQKETYATYTWNFGDGSAPVTGFAPGSPPCETPWLSPCAASPFHSYRYGGTYEVTLTVTDVGGDTASSSRRITVVGPPPPSPEAQTPPAQTGGGSSASGGSTSTGGTTTGGKQPAGGKAPAPVAAQAVLTHSLRSALRKGLLVSYAVNEQVAGHFEVLLDRSTASRLGVSGPAALGLPAGSAPAVVVGRAILITTAGGRSTVKIVFTKRVASRLAHAHKLSLMLRLVVRNAGQSPTSTTVVSTFTLTH
jgi:hypothetical protein